MGANELGLVKLCVRARNHNTMDSVVMIDANGDERSATPMGLHLDCSDVISRDVFAVYLSAFEQKYNMDNLKLHYAEPRVHNTPNFLKLCMKNPDPRMDTLSLLNAMRAIKTTWAFFFSPMVGFYKESPDAPAVDRFGSPDTNVLNTRQNLFQGPRPLPKFEIGKLRRHADLLEFKKDSIEQFKQRMHLAQAYYATSPTSDGIDYSTGALAGPFERTRWFLEYELTLFIFFADASRISYVEDATPDDHINWIVRCSEFHFLKVLYIGKLMQMRREGIELPDFDARFNCLAESTPFYEVTNPVFSGLHKSLDKFDVTSYCDAKATEERNKHLAQLKTAYANAKKNAGYPTATSNPISGSASRKRTIEALGSNVDV